MDRSRRRRGHTCPSPMGRPVRPKRLPLVPAGPASAWWPSSGPPRRRGQERIAAYTPNQPVAAPGGDSRPAVARRDVGRVVGRHEQGGFLAVADVKGGGRTVPQPDHRARWSRHPDPVLLVFPKVQADAGRALREQGVVAVRGQGAVAR